MSDGEWPDAVSSVSVHVREIRDEIIYNSASLRLTGTQSTQSGANFPKNDLNDLLSVNKNNI